MKKFLTHVMVLVTSAILIVSSALHSANVAYAQSSTYPQLSQIDQDVARSLMNARLAMRDIAECNLYMLGRISGVLSQEANNLMRLQGWTFGRLQEMGQNLHDILSQMEDLMPGEPGAKDYAFEGLKTALGAAGLIPGFGVIAYGASLTVQAGEVYAKWHNSSQAAGIANDIKANAQQQIDAFQGAVSLYNDIVSGLAEIKQYQARIQALLDSYEERCLKKGEAADTGPYNYIPSSDTASPGVIDSTVRDAMLEYDPCDLRRLIALNGFLTAQLANLQNQQQQLFNDLLNKNNELNAALSNLENGLPQPPNWGWEGGKAIFGLLGGRSASTVGQSVTAFAGGTLSQVSDMQDTLEGVEASEALKGPVREKMRELEQLVRQHDELMQVLIRVREQQQRVQHDIETWEERCTKAPEDDESVGLLPGDGGFLIGSDGTQWCTYGFGGPTVVPVTPIGGGIFTPSGPLTPAPAGTPDGSTPGGPTTTPVSPGVPGGIYDPDDDDDIFTPSDDGPTTATPVPSTPVIPLGPTSQTPPPSEPAPEDTEDPEDDGEDPVDDDPRDAPGPQLIVKAKQSVLQGGSAGKAVAGQQIKLFADATIAQDLPHTSGAEKNDVGYDADPMQCTTGKGGSCKIDLPKENFKTGAMPKFEAKIDVTKQNSLNVQVTPPANGKPAATALPSGVQQYASDTQVINGKHYVTVTYPASKAGSVKSQFKNAENIIGIETNFCRDKQPKSAPVSLLPTHGGIGMQMIDLEGAR